MTLNNTIFPRVSLGQLFRIKHGFAFKGEYFSEEPGEIVLTPGNFQPTGGLKLRPEKDRSYTGAFPDEFRLQTGDLVVVMTDLTQEARILGAPAFIPEGVHCLHNQRIGKVVNLDATRLDVRFLYYLLNTREFRETIKSTATGATVKHTSPSRITSYESNLPSLVLQRRIASILGAYDDLIEVNRQRTALLEEMAHRLFDEWFVRFRFAGHEGHAIVETPDGSLPEGWEWQPLEWVCTRPNGIQTGPFGSQLHQSDYVADGVPVVMPRNIIDFRVIQDDIARISEQKADELGRHRMKIGDVVYGRRGDIGRRAYISKLENGWFCGTGCLRLRADLTRVSSRYFFDALGQPETLGAIRGRAQGVTMPIRPARCQHAPSAAERRFHRIHRHASHRGAGRRSLST